MRSRLRAALDRHGGARADRRPGGQWAARCSLEHARREARERGMTVFAARGASSSRRSRSASCASCSSARCSARRPSAAPSCSRAPPRWPRPRSASTATRPPVDAPFSVLHGIYWLDGQPRLRRARAARGRRRALGRRAEPARAGLPRGAAGRAPRDDRRHGALGRPRSTRGCSTSSRVARARRPAARRRSAPRGSPRCSPRAGRRRRPSWSRPPSGRPAATRSCSRSCSARCRRPRPEVARLTSRALIASVLLRLGQLRRRRRAVARAVAILDGHAELRHVAALAGVDEAEAGRRGGGARGGRLPAARAARWRSRRRWSARACWRT